MRFDRRVLLRSLAALSGLGLSAVRARAAPMLPKAAAPSGDGLAPLGAWLDTLLPADGASPSATALGCEAALRTKAAANASYRRLLEAGCGWLEAQAGPAGFGGLDEARREAIAVRAARSAGGSLPETFFRFTRLDAFAHYYAQPASWPALGYAGPPQPEGFPDHAELWKGPA